MANEIKPEQVPKEVIAAFRAALKRDDTSFEEDFCTALNAWPGMFEYRYHDNGELALILPLPPQENENG